MEEKNGSKAGKAIAILFGVMFAGLLVYAVVALSNKEKAASSETTTEQYNDDHGLSFTYPAGYVISTDDVENGVVDVLCEVKGSDVSQIEFSTVSMPGVEEFSRSEKEEVCCAALEGMKEEYKNTLLYRNVTFSSIQSGYLGKYPCYRMDINVTILSVTSKGVAKVAITEGGQLIITVSLYENEKYKNTLEKIEQSRNLQ